MRFRPGFYLRFALIADLWVYLVALVLFVLLPVFPVERGAGLEGNTVTTVEWSLAALAIPVAVGLLGRLVQRPKIPGNEWAYLVVAGYGLLNIAVVLLVAKGVIGDVIVEPTVVPILVTWGMIGIVGGAGAHAFDGGKRPLGPRVERWLRYREGGDA